MLLQRGGKEPERQVVLGKPGFIGGPLPGIALFTTGCGSARLRTA